MGWSPSFFRAGRPAALGFPPVEASVDNFMTGYCAPMDPNDLLCMAWKWQHGDVCRHSGGDLAAALGRMWVEKAGAQIQRRHLCRAKRASGLALISIESSR
jgi:homoserine acetyltransferase